MKHQYKWITQLLNQIPQLNINFKSRQECDDDFVQCDFEGGNDYQYHGGHKEGHGHSHGEETLE